VADPLRDQLQNSLGTAYTLERELSGGGMAHVFLARDETLGRPVVVKVLPIELGTGLSAERFAREIRLAAQLQEPHIVPVLTAGTTTEGLPYYTMPFVRGESLRARLASGPLPIPEATSILRDVARALAYAHQQGIVHRDIKPENVLLAGETAMVTDFGIAKAVGDAREPHAAAAGTLTEVGTSLGTPAYMAPEQAAGDAVDHRADLYAWGLLAYELLTGKHPFAGRATARQLIAAHIGSAPTPLSAERADVPFALAALVMSCLEKERERRPQSAETIVASLSAVGIPLPAPRRGMLATAAVAIVVIAVVVGLALRGRSGQTPRALSTTSVGASETTDAPRVAASLAVLPLANYSRDSSQEYFADGMTDELTSTLSKLQALRVIAHRSMLQFKGSSQPVPEIAKRLDVKYVVDGSVMQEGNRVRIRATLLDAATNTLLWNETFDRERRDVMALQREVALAIASKIAITLTPQDRARLGDTLPVDPVAFDHYIRGTQARYKAFGDAEEREAMRHFERAIERDSNFAPAYTGMAHLQALLGDGAGARRSAERARALDPTLAEAPMVLGMVLQLYDHDWKGAEAAFREAIRLNPGHAEAHHELSMHLMRLGRFEDARREGQRTLSLAPLAPRFEHGLGEIHLFAGRYDDAIAAANKALALDSTYVASYLILIPAHAEQGRFEEAYKAWDACKQHRCPKEVNWSLGYAYALAGRRVEARRILDELKTEAARAGGPPDVTHIAAIHAALGERAQALDWLQRGIGTGSFMAYVGIDPAFRSLRAEPRFRQILTTMGLPEPSAAGEHR
jgi:TolB-like protein/tRNA A-37 threonylcarbamoyl transferase component Bud32/Flp pilus assembly protein TadD